ncbi:hypothetical protein DL96DRAFT_1579453 [Flagelloscypha sp. PMI_526]|nr:hypothetical protein DL96DRAFT_1579453 [Flagelloscypha sp. PMI_526]
MAPSLKSLLKHARPMKLLQHSERTIASHSKLEESVLSTTLPLEIWLRVALWLDDATLKQLGTLNHMFYSLALDARYHHLAIDTTRDRFQALANLRKLFKRLGGTQDDIAGRVKSIWISDDVLHNFTFHSKTLCECRTKHGFWRRMHGLGREIKLTYVLFTEKPFARCTSVEKLELVFNGPWFLNKDNSFHWYIYVTDDELRTGLQMLCTPFVDSLRELNITIENTELVPAVFKFPPLNQFPRLEVLDLQLSRKLSGITYSTDEFRTFICHFRETLRVLRLKYKNLGDNPLGLLIGNCQQPFPCLSTLEIHHSVTTSGWSSRGYPHLTNFLIKCPALKRLVLHSSGTDPYWIPDDDMHLNFPHPLILEELGIDDLSWSSHGNALDEVLGTGQLLINAIDCRSPTSSSLFRNIFATTSQWRNCMTKLTLGVILFNVDDFILHMDQLPALEVLFVACKHLAVHEKGMSMQSVFDEVDSNAEESLESLGSVVDQESVTSFLSKPTVKHYKLHSIDIIRNPLPHGSGYEKDFGCVDCPEVRLWDTIHVFARAFPSISVFGRNVGRLDVFEYRQGSLLCQVCGGTGLWNVNTNSLM